MHEKMERMLRAVRRSRVAMRKMPEKALVARTTSTPLAVRLRRSKKFGPVAVGASDATRSGLTPSDQARFDRHKAIGLIAEKFKEREWGALMNRRRSRVRGIEIKEGIKKAVGREVYLPNIIFRLVRNNTLPGQPYNPYEATFRIPRSVTKTDIRSYLLAVYGVATTYIRTDNYISALFPRLGNKRKPFKTYKRAVVGLVKPFTYPLRLEDMAGEEKKEREKWIEDNFQIQAHRSMMKYELLRMTKGQAKGWKFKEPFATKRSHILRLVAERREKREGLIQGQVYEWRQSRERGEIITMRQTATPPPAPPANDVTSSVPVVAN